MARVLTLQHRTMERSDPSTEWKTELRAIVKDPIGDRFNDTRSSIYHAESSIPIFSGEPECVLRRRVESPL